MSACLRDRIRRCSSWCVSELIAANRLAGRERLMLPGHRLELTPEEGRAREAIEGTYKRAGLKPPDLATVAAEASRVPVAVVDRMTSLLLRQKASARVDTLIFHADALSRTQGRRAGTQSRRPRRARER